MKAMRVRCRVGWLLLCRSAAGALTLLLVCIVLLLPAQPRPQQQQQQELQEQLPSDADSLMRLCSQLRPRGDPSDLPSNLQYVLRWLCLQLEEPPPVKPSPVGCNKTVTYHPIGRLGNLMGLYAIIYSYGRIFGTAGHVEDEMRNKLTRYFPRLSLPSTSSLPPDTHWHRITFQEAEQRLACRPGETYPEPQHYLITNYPDRNGIDVFQPFYSELRREFEFSPRLREQAQMFLHHARGDRTSVTYIGVHVRRTDYRAYIRNNYNGSLPDEEYFSRALGYYRRRFSDALFIVCSDELEYVAKQLHVRQHEDMVLAGNRDLNDPGRDIALLAACNHSVVTVGTYGFWGAYLAGGTVLVPEQQTHLSMGDRHAPLLEIQLAGASNWVAMR